MAIAVVPKLKQVGLSRTETGVEIAAKLIPLQSNMTIICSSIDQGPAQHGRQNFLGNTPLDIHTHGCYLCWCIRGALFDKSGCMVKRFAVGLAFTIDQSISAESSHTNSEALIFFPLPLCVMLNHSNMYTVKRLLVMPSVHALSV